LSIAANISPPSANSRTVRPASRSTSPSTNRIDSSSSAIQTSSAIGASERQQQGKHRVPGTSIVAQAAAVFVGDLRRQRKAETGAAGTSRDERQKQIVAQAIRHAAAVVDDVETRSQAHGLVADQNVVRSPRTQTDACRAGLEGIAQEIQDQLQQAI